MWKLVGLIVLVGGGRDNLEPTDRLAPRGWVGNPWGPEAYAARKAGKIPQIPISPSMKRWDDWGAKNLRDGDILFRRGDARILFGKFPMSRFIANVSGSAFSHTGIAAIEEGRPFVFDTTKSGVRRQPLSVWVLDNVGPFGVKRLKPPYQDRVPRVLSWCREIYAKQPPFDYDLNPDDSELYCVEMTEKAYPAPPGWTFPEPSPPGRDGERRAVPDLHVRLLHADEAPARPARLLPRQRAARDLVVAPPGYGRRPEDRDRRRQQQQPQPRRPRPTPPGRRSRGSEPGISPCPRERIPVGSAARASPAIAFDSKTSAQRTLRDRPTERGQGWPPFERA